MRHFGFDDILSDADMFSCAIALLHVGSLRRNFHRIYYLLVYTQKVRSSETKIANPKQVSYYFPVPYKTLHQAKYFGILHHLSEVRDFDFPHHHGCHGVYRFVQQSR